MLYHLAGVLKNNSDKKAVFYEIILKKRMPSFKLHYFFALFLTYYIKGEITRTKIMIVLKTSLNDYTLSMLSLIKHFSYSTSICWLI